MHDAAYERHDDPPCGLETGALARTGRAARADRAGRTGRAERVGTLALPSGEPIDGPVRLRIDVGDPGDVQDMGDGFEVTLAEGAELVLGSTDASDVIVDDPSVSARHCRVGHAGTAIEVSDLGARNGLRVASVRVSSATLPLGAVFEMGRTRVRVQPAVGRTIAPSAPLRGLVGASPPMRALAGRVRKLAPLRLPVLLRGESGTGKDLVARAVHDESPRADAPFVVLNAAAISRELAESELFGHRRGAFTGAIKDRRGAFREADGGTLFLDEIGAIPLDLQAKLLRAVEEGAVRPVGGEASVRVDVRLCAATCEPLEALVEQKRFRADLYERLAVCVVVVPPLRARSEDVPALARHLLAASDLGERTLAPDAVAALRAHRWPGNVRELRNVLVQAALGAGAEIGASDVAAVLAERGARTARLAPAEARRLLEQAGGNVSEAARRADLPRSTMRDLVRAAGVAPRRGRSDG